MSEHASSPWKRIWDAIGFVGDLQTVGQLAVASGAASWVTSQMPAGWHPSQYWITPAFVFFTTWFVTGSLVVIARKVFSRIVRGLNPATLSIEAHSGDYGVLTLMHAGPPTTYSADGRIISTFDGTPNPRAHPYQYAFWPKGGPSRPTIELRDGEWANIHVANFLGNMGRGGLIRLFAGAGEVIVPRSGVRLEITINAVPPPTGGKIVKCFWVQAEAGDYITFIEEFSPEAFSPVEKP